MKLSKNSEQIMLFFSKNKYINNINQPKKTNDIFFDLYNDIYESYKYLNNLKKNKYFHISIKKITNKNQIVKPKNFNSKSFPDIIRKHIDETSVFEIVYTFSLFERDIKIIFVLENEYIEHDINKSIKKYNDYIDTIIMWLYILNLYSSKKCANTLVVYFYFTSLKKNLPSSKIIVLDEMHVNTAFTTSCPKDSEIVVFRKEEWFKVFIHETFHNFALDFSDMNTSEVHKCILSIFKVNSLVNLFESYTEFWAEIMNALFCSFFSLKNKENINEFLSTAEVLIHFERKYSFFQLVKTLNFMGLNYSDLYLNNKHSQTLRNHLYKENSNVLAYYIIKTILMNNYPLFLQWCKRENFSLLQFKKTISNQIKFCDFIKKNYKTKSMLENVDNTQHFLYNLTKKNNNNNYDYDYLLSNLRMSICELG